MKTLLLFLIKKLLKPEKVAHLVAGIIANLLRKASKSGKWDLFRSIVQKIEKEKIADAIEELADADTIKNILNKVDVMM